ncbi:MAG TPA: AAA family ATPase [Solirubrobacteraceae bacterium]|jgi:ABC-type lipoprotein export system ATPase subunit|nr:AAA family ATPase [Solirubrobacteraceae bacterium]
MSKKSTQIKFPRGSEWRRWDLHVHTPLSALNNGFGNDFDAYAKELFEKALAREIAVIGVTDYFTIDGYKALRALQKDTKRLQELLGAELAARAQQIRLLANIEFRLDVIVRVAEKDARVNAHVIFSDEVSSREIEENFLHRLEFLSESAPGSSDDAKSLTVANLKEFGARLKAEHPPFADRTDLEVGMTQAVISHSKISEVLAKNRAAFERRHLFVIAADEDLSNVPWDGQGHSTRKFLLQKSHMLFSSNMGTRAFGLGQRSESVAAFEGEFRSRKACIHGSDAHRPQDLFVFAEDRQLWVRADPTFDGLVQLYHEPDARVFIGAEPPALQRVRESATKSIQEIAFKRDTRAGAEARWFSGSVPLNAGLVALIGKKGSGKSALADVLGLLGDARTGGEFSFLNTERFLNPRDNLGRFFRTSAAHPSNHLEKVCVEIRQSSRPTLFDKELEAVIFSHVPRADRLGQTSLEDLFAHTTEETEAGIGLLRKKLAQVNREDVELRRRSSEESRRRLEGELEQRRSELEAHRKAKPALVKDPGKESGADPDTQKAEKDLTEVVAAIEKLDKSTKERQDTQALTKRRLVAIERTLTRIANLATTVEEFYTQSAKDAKLLDLDPRKLVRIETQETELKALHEQTLREVGAHAEALDEEREGSDAQKRNELSMRAEDLRRKLTEPQRRYQEYLRALANWEKQEAEIIGAASEPKSVEGLQARVAELDKLPERASAKRDEREALVREVFAAKSKLLDSYRELYHPVQRFVAEHPVAQEVSELSFDAVIAVRGLEDGILELIDQRRRGSFQGDQEGRERLRALIKKYDFASADNVVEFLAEIGKHLASDVRGDPPQQVTVATQLMRSRSEEDLCDFLFGLEYLKPRFKLLWRDKPLDQLSPGERGTLLLLFYLLVDREDVPLVIDQPEENLDNETVAELLVPAVKHAKERRQIILVTHNPNLAVVCDADQVIHASIEKTEGNRVTYTSGAIEDPTMTRLIVDVLEGTKPAFDIRDAKYEVLDRAGDQTG